MKIGLLGDVHGASNWTQHALTMFSRAEVKEIYQVGDFGIEDSIRGKFFLDKVERTLAEHDQNMIVVPGNHEDYGMIEDPQTAGSIPPVQALTERIHVVPRGTVWQAGGLIFMGFGGAASIDWKLRTEGVDWWPAEMFRESDFLRLEGFEPGVVDVLLTHEASSGGTAAVQKILTSTTRYNGWDYRYAGESTKFMDRVVAAIQPKMHVHGHMHVAGERLDSEEGRLYISLDMNGTRNNGAVLDTETREVEWIEF